MDANAQGQGTPTQERQAPEIIELTDDAVYKHPTLGEIQGKELKNGYLRQADYTRKTQSLSERERVINDNLPILEALSVLTEAEPEVQGKLAQVIQNGYKYAPSAPQGGAAPVPPRSTPQADGAAPRPDPRITAVEKQLQGLNRTIAERDVDAAIAQLAHETGMDPKDIEEKILPETRQWFNPQFNIVENMRRTWRTYNHEMIERGEVTGAKVLQKIASQGPGASASNMQTQETEKEKLMKQIFSQTRPGASLFAKK